LNPGNDKAHFVHAKMPANDAAWNWLWYNRMRTLL
jgi:hypothetical protein